MHDLLLTEVRANAYNQNSRRAISTSLMLRGSQGDDSDGYDLRRNHFINSVVSRATSLNFSGGGLFTSRTTVFSVSQSTPCCIEVKFSERMRLPTLKPMMSRSQAGIRVEAIQDDGTDVSRDRTNDCHFRECRDTSMRRCKINHS